MRKFSRPGVDTLILGATAMVILLSAARGLVGSVSERASHAITETESGNGFRAFNELKNELLTASSTKWRRALLKEADLEPFDTYYLLTPKRPLSDREEKILLAWVQDGGRLIISFEEKASVKNVTRFLNAAGINAFLTDQPNFENGKAQPAVAAVDSALLRAGEKYEFYSLLGFRDGDCLADATKCFVREGRIGKGTLIAFAGVPPFANALLGSAENGRLAARLALLSERSAFDEFHQFLTEKSVGDFLLDPTILFPLLGFATLVFLYFFFGTGDLQERDLEITRPGKAAGSYHALNRLIVQQAYAGGGQTGAAEASAWQTKALERTFPREIENIRKSLDGASDDSERARRLIEFHRNWLKGRGRK